mgnify:CR=1 FL=1
MSKIAIGGFLHETNCFVPMKTDYAYYATGGEFPPLAHGQELIAVSYTHLPLPTNREV